MSKNYISGILFKKELDSNNNIIGRTPILPRTLTSEIITNEKNDSDKYVKLSDILDNITTITNSSNNKVEISSIKTNTLYTDKIAGKTDPNVVEISISTIKVNTLYTDSITSKTDSNTSILFNKNIVPQSDIIYNIGDTNNRFNNIYARNVHADTHVITGGNADDSMRNSGKFNISGVDNSQNSELFSLRLDYTPSDNSTDILLEVTPSETIDSVIHKGAVTSYLPIKVNNIRVTVNSKTCYIGYGTNEYHYNLDINNTIYNKIIQFQNAIKDAIESGYNEIIILSGVYYLGCPIIVTRANITIKGLGYNTSIRTPYHTPTFIVESDGVCIRDMSICKVIGSILYDTLYNTDISDMKTWWNNGQPSIFPICDGTYSKDSVTPEYTSDIILKASSCTVDNINFVNMKSDYAIDIVDRSDEEANYKTYANQFINYFNTTITITAGDLIGNINKLIRYGFVVLLSSVQNWYNFIPKSSSTSDEIAVGNNDGVNQGLNYIYKIKIDEYDINPNYTIKYMMINSESTRCKIIFNESPNEETVIELNGSMNFNFSKACKNIDNSIVTWASFWKFNSIDITATSYNNFKEFITSTLHGTVKEHETDNSVTITFSNISLRINYNKTNFDDSLICDKIYIVDKTEFTTSDGINIKLYYKDKLVDSSSSTKLIKFWYPYRKIGSEEDPKIDTGLEVISIKDNILYTVGDITSSSGFDPINRSNISITPDNCFYDSRTDDQSKYLKDTTFFSDNDNYDIYSKYLGFSSIFVDWHWQLFTSNTTKAVKYAYSYNKITNCLFQNSYQMFKVYENDYYTYRYNNAKIITLNDFTTDNVNYNNGSLDTCPKTIVSNSTSTNARFRICDTLYSGIFGGHEYKEDVVSYKTTNDIEGYASVNITMNPRLIKLLKGEDLHR